MKCSADVNFVASSLQNNNGEYWHLICTWKDIFFAEVHNQWKCEKLYFVNAIIVTHIIGQITAKNRLLKFIDKEKLNNFVLLF